MPLPTLTFNERTIMGTIDVLTTFAERLGLSEEMVCNKIIMIRGDLLTVRNVRQTLFQRRGKLMKINRFDWLEPTAGLFHLQMNLLTMLFDKLWGKPGNIASLGQYAGVLKRPKVSKDMKNFHACDTFLKHLIDADVIALVMEENDQKSIDEFQTWIAQSDWPSAIKRTQEQYLRPYYIQKVRADAKKKTEAEVIATLSDRKKEWLGFVEERDTPEPEPNWDDIKKEIHQSTTIQNCDIVRENLLLITSLGLLYIDFANACCIGHSGRIEQCIRCFAVIFQTTRSTKYAREMMHMVACFKRL